MPPPESNPDVHTAPRDADADKVAGLRPPSARQPLSRDRVIQTAIAFIDEHGLPGLTMRRLGNELGVEAMALYRYVPGKEELLDGVVEALIESMRQDEDVLDTPSDGWQDFLIRLAHGVRRVALQHPKAFPLVASRPPEAPWLRPPLRSLAWVEVFLSGLLAEGFTEDAAVAAYRAYTSVLLGHLLLEVSNHGADVGPLDALGEDSGDDPEEAADASTVRDYPVVHRLRAQLSQDHAATEFEESLEELLGRMTLLRNEHSQS
ncbi:TetR/AcrR family transcriptional regulator [Nocardioides piscis]|uniref:TetR/AcrR family transcriptional regulator n=1 Tax=Nocardioides piscis TaxID=2714938 RepID=UPI0019811167|nr:TetR family transcriptional regulator [Nocardioides piscis]